MTETREQTGERPAARPPSLFEALIPVVLLIASLSASYYLFHDKASYGPNQGALLLCGAVAAANGYKNGLAWDDIRQAVINGVGVGISAIGILLAVGALIGTWALSGTIVAMVYYGLEI